MGGDQRLQAAVAHLMRFAWRTVGQILQRVVGETAQRVDLLAGLRRIGSDEIATAPATGT